MASGSAGSGLPPARDCAGVVGPVPRGSNPWPEVCVAAADRAEVRRQGTSRRQVDDGVRGLGCAGGSLLRCGGGRLERHRPRPDGHRDVTALPSGRCGSTDGASSSVPGRPPSSSSYPSSGCDRWWRSSGSIPRPASTGRRQAPTRRPIRSTMPGESAAPRGSRSGRDERKARPNRPASAGPAPDLAPCRTGRSRRRPRPRPPRPGDPSREVWVPCRCRHPVATRCPDPYRRSR